MPVSARREGGHQRRRRQWRTLQPRRHAHPWRTPCQLHADTHKNNLMQHVANHRSLPGGWRWSHRRWGTPRRSAGRGASTSEMVSQKQFHTVLLQQQLPCHLRLQRMHTAAAAGRRRRRRMCGRSAAALRAAAARRQRCPTQCMTRQQNSAATLSSHYHSLKGLTSTKPLPIWSSSRKDWSLWSTVPASTLPAQLEQAPARQL